MIVLAFDTSGPWVAACLWRDRTAQDTKVEEMARGQAERLMLLLEDMLQAHALCWQDLNAIGVGTGPGNFTGIRIAVSAARGLAMGLEQPAVGVNGFEARAACHPDGTFIGIPAPRGQIYIADPTPRLVAAAEHPDAVLNTAPAALVKAIAALADDRRINPAPPVPLYVKPAPAVPSHDAPPVLLD